MLLRTMNYDLLNLPSENAGEHFLDGWVINVRAALTILAFFGLAVVGASRTTALAQSTVHIKVREGLAAAHAVGVVEVWLVWWAVSDVRVSCFVAVVG